jgi:hypothetical protein
MLTELNALVAARLSARSAFPMLFFDSLSVRTIIVVMVYVSVLRRILLRVGMVRTNFCHKLSPVVIFGFNCRFGQIL